MATTGRPKGRPSIPVAKKISEGNKGKRKLFIPDKIVNEGVPTPPESLNEDGIRVWNTIFSTASDYIDVNVDILQVETFCHLYEETEFMRRMISLGSFAGGVDRIVYINDGKTLTRHPYVQDIKDNRILMNSILSAFGFTPADRARLHFEQKVESKLGELMKNVSNVAALEDM